MCVAGTVRCVFVCVCVNALRFVCIANACCAQLKRARGIAAHAQSEKNRMEAELDAMSMALARAHDEKAEAAAQGKVRCCNTVR